MVGKSIHHLHILWILVLVGICLEPKLGWSAKGFLECPIKAPYDRCLGESRYGPGFSVENVTKVQNGLLDELTHPPLHHIKDFYPHIHVFPVSRASAKHIGAIMTMLAVFDEAQVLPPEGSPEADQLVHTLIQSQSAFLKSSDPAVRSFFSKALASYFFERAPDKEKEFFDQGWTSEILESVVLYAGYPNVWKNSALVKGLQAFNVTPEDIHEMQIIFDQARQRFIRLDLDIHDVYWLKRQGMPGAKP